MPLKLPQLRWTHRYDVSAKGLYVVTVFTMDHLAMEFTLSNSSTGFELLDYVAQRLELDETRVFGFRYEMAETTGGYRQLLLNKPVRKQLDKHAAGAFLLFSVLFYVEQPQLQPKEGVRHQFYLQLRHDLSRGLLQPNVKQAIKLAIYALQAEHGDFISEEVTQQIWRKCQPLSTELMPGADNMHQLAFCEDLICGYRHLSGLSSVNAQWYFLDQARQCTNYGLELFYGANKSMSVGVCKRGISLWWQVTSLGNSSTSGDLSTRASSTSTMMRVLRTGQSASTTAINNKSSSGRPFPEHGSMALPRGGSDSSGMEDATITADGAGGNLASLHLQWEDIKDFAYTKKLFTIQRIRRSNKPIQIAMKSHYEAKYLWKYCIEVHKFHVEHLSTYGPAIISHANLPQPPDVIRGVTGKDTSSTASSSRFNGSQSLMEFTQANRGGKHSSKQHGKESVNERRQLSGGQVSGSPSLSSSGHKRRGAAGSSGGGGVGGRESVASGSIGGGGNGRESVTTHSAASPCPPSPSSLHSPQPPSPGQYFLPNAPPKRYSQQALPPSSSSYSEPPPYGANTAAGGAGGSSNLITTNPLLNSHRPPSNSSGRSPNGNRVDDSFYDNDTAQSSPPSSSIGIRSIANNANNNNNNQFPLTSNRSSHPSPASPTSANDPLTELLSLTRTQNLPLSHRLLAEYQLQNGAAANNQKRGGGDAIMSLSSPSAANLSQLDSSHHRQIPPSGIQQSLSCQVMGRGGLQHHYVNEESVLDAELILMRYRHAGDKTFSSEDSSTASSSRILSIGSVGLGSTPDDSSSATSNATFCVNASQDDDERLLDTSMMMSSSANGGGGGGGCGPSRNIMVSSWTATGNVHHNGVNSNSSNSGRMDLLASSALHWPVRSHTALASVPITTISTNNNKSKERSSQHENGAIIGGDNTTRSSTLDKKKSNVLLPPSSSGGERGQSITPTPSGYPHCDSRKSSCASTTSTVGNASLDAIKRDRKHSSGQHLSSSGGIFARIQRFMKFKKGGISQSMDNLKVDSLALETGVDKSLPAKRRSVSDLHLTQSTTTTTAWSSAVQGNNKDHHANLFALPPRPTGGGGGGGGGYIHHQHPHGSSHSHPHPSSSSSSSGIIIKSNYNKKSTTNDYDVVEVPWLRLTDDLAAQTETTDIKTLQETLLTTKLGALANQRQPVNSPRSTSNFVLACEQLRAEFGRLPQRSERYACDIGKQVEQRSRNFPNAGLPYDFNRVHLQSTLSTTPTSPTTTTPGGFNDYINAAHIKLELNIRGRTSRQWYIVAPALPSVDGNQALLWRMIWQQKIAVIFILGPKDAVDSRLFPQNRGQRLDGSEIIVENEWSEISPEGSTSEFCYILYSRESANTKSRRVYLFHYHHVAWSAVNPTNENSHSSRDGCIPCNPARFMELMDQAITLHRALASPDGQQEQPMALLSLASGWYDNGVALLYLSMLWLLDHNVSMSPGHLLGLLRREGYMRLMSTTEQYTFTLYCVLQHLRRLRPL